MVALIRRDLCLFYIKLWLLLTFFPLLLFSVYKPNKMKIISSLLLLLLVSITACQFNKPAAVNIPLEGIYKGTLPCADCAGIESRLILNRDKTFIYENTYIDRVDGRFTDRGSYTVKENIVTIERNNTPVYFLIEKNSLILLGSDLQPAKGKLAPYYILKKQGEFSYSGRYETFSAEEGEYRQVLTIAPQGKDYQINFSASKVGGRENCYFSGIARLRDGKLWANISTDKDREILMSIAPTHDNLGVDVFTPDFAQRFQLMLYCRGGASLAGEYIKNTITADSIGVITASTTIAEVLHTLPLTQIVKKTGTGEFADDTYDDYEILTRNNQHLFTLTPKSSGDVRQKIERVVIKSPFFTTAKGISCQSTYQDISNAYTITKIVPDIDHIILVVDEINAHFSIAKSALRQGWWDNTCKTVNRNKIPADAEIDSFILWWNQ